jgi:hypothetical protein
LERTAGIIVGIESIFSDKEKDCPKIFSMILFVIGRSVRLLEVLATIVWSSLAIHSGMIIFAKPEEFWIRMKPIAACLGDSECFPICC